jgi:beta-glucanase (GH16 family)
MTRLMPTRTPLHRGLGAIHSRRWSRLAGCIVAAALVIGLPVAAGSTAAASTVPDPSGVPMPGAKAGWYMTFSDDFLGTSLNTNKWYEYTGHPGGEPETDYSPSHDVVTDGMLILKGYKDDGVWTTGGVSNGKSGSQTYGKYEVRFKMDEGIGITYAALLWPANNTWPPEVDFAEDDSAARSNVNAFQHFAKADGTDGQFINQTAVNMTQWHTLGVEWTPDRITYTLDGAAWAVQTNTYVPSIPMVLDLQTEAIACTGNNPTQCISSSTPSEVDMDIDWVVEYGQDQS